MSLNPEIKKVLVLGPVNSLYNNRAEYVVSCVEACKALKEQGLEVALIFANENFQLAQKSIADVVYSEPLCLETFEKIIKKEKPDIILPVFGGKKALSLVQEAGEKGILSENQVESPWLTWENIKNITDHQLFKDILLKINEPGITSKIVTSGKDAISYAESSIGYPVFVKPVIENGKTEGIIVQTREELQEAAELKLKESTSAQIVIEKSISGWKQIQFSIMRDRNGITATICSMESLEPVENQNHKSVLISPASSISTLEFAMLENAAKRIINALELCGCCNITFALKPNSKEYVLLEVNPTLNKISTFSSKAADYPLAKNSALLTCGFTIPELNVQNDNGSYSVYAARQVAIELNIVEPVMAVGATFEEALMKTCQSNVFNNLGLRSKNLEFESNDEIRAIVEKPSPYRLFAVYEAIRRNILTHEEIYRIIRIDWCYLDRLQNIADLEKKLEDVRKGVTLLSFDLYESAKIMGFSDDLIQSISGTSVSGANGIITLAETARTLAENRKLAHLACGYNFIAKREGKRSNIFHSVYQGEIIDFSQFESENPKEKVLVVGGCAESYEYDSNTVKAIQHLKQEGYEVAVICNSMLSLSISCDISDRVYLECPTAENIMNVVLKENPSAVYLSFAGEKLLELSAFLEQQALKLPGCSTAAKKIAENLSTLPENAFVDSYVSVDVLTDAKNILIPAIIEKMNLCKKEQQKISVYPLWNLSDVIRDKIIKQSFAIAQKLNIKGIFNVEFAIQNNTPFIKKINPFASSQLSFVSAITKIPVVELSVNLMNGKELASLGYGSGVYKLPACNCVRINYASSNLKGDHHTYTAVASSKKEALYKALQGADYKVQKDGAVYFALEGDGIFDLPAIAKTMISLGYSLYGNKSNVKLLKDFGIEAVLLEDSKHLETLPVAFVVASEKEVENICVPEQTLCISSISVVKELLEGLKADFDAKTLSVVDINGISPVRANLNFTKMNSNGNDFIVINGDDLAVENIQSLAIDLCKRCQSVGAQFLVVITGLGGQTPFVKLYSSSGKEIECANEALSVAARFCYEKMKKTEGANFQLETNDGIKNLILYKKNNVVTSVCQKMEAVSPDCENMQVFAGGMNYNAAFVKYNNIHCVINSNFPDKIDIESYGNMLWEEMKEYSEKSFNGIEKETYLQFISYSSDNSVRSRTWNKTQGELVSSVDSACAAVIAGVINGWCKKDQDIFVASKGGKVSVRYTNDTLYITSAVETVFQGQILI